MEKEDIQQGLNEFVEELTSQTYLNTFRTQSRDSLLVDGIGTRANSIWKMSQFLVATYDTKNEPLDKYLEGWKKLTKNYKDQYLIIQTDNTGNWLMYDSYSNCLGGNDYIQEFLKKREKLKFNSNMKSKQKIFYGAPGTGKSQKIKLMEKEGKLICRRITFHPDTDYSAFVGAYKPVMDNDASGNEVIKYKFQEQILLQTFYDAWKDRDHDYAIVIEELNRGNCAQIFGDIFQLLDRREDGYSDYPIYVDKDIQDSMRKSLPEQYDGTLKGLYLRENGESSITNGWSMLTLPPNLNILATMNTSDNSLYKMDSAFKRRWDWEYVEIDYNDDKLINVELQIDGLVDKNWMHILKKINEYIKLQTLSTSKQIGQWFVIPEKTDGQYKNISFESFRDKVVFYLFNDVFKDTDDLKSIIAPNEDVYLFEDLFSENDKGKNKCLTLINDLLAR